MTYEEALADMCKDCCLHPCKALKNKDYCYSYNILNKALEKADKYIWHDLRQNPDDLPCKDGLYAITTQYDEELLETGFGQYENMYGYTSGWSATMPSCGKIIAWKEIEPFEVTE